MHKPISRKESTALGLKNYFTGKPCIRGHIDLRNTKDKSCAQCRRDSARDYKAKNPERKKASDAAYAAANRERVAEIKRRHYERNKDKIKERVKQWSIDNKDQAQANWNAATRAYRARQRSAEGSHGAKDVSKLYELQQGKCACCKINLKKYHVDHINPLSAGGSNDFYNLQLLCPHCNLSKGAKDPIAFMQERGYLL